MQAAVILCKQTFKHCLSPFTCNGVTLVGRLPELQWAVTVMLLERSIARDGVL